ncbi:MAG: anti-sigma F factor [Oscillospiraceae bacterium]|jgi:stage II sporulation protein AB (anti-sigma F factor)|nr:anti-sigma F factor [Oscillospiraceae bacterium]
MKHNSVNQIKLELESRSVNESFARAVVAAFAAQLDPTVEELSDIKTAVSEAVTNCIVHAYPNNCGRVWITVIIHDSGLVRIRVRDKGCGIPDITKAREPLFTTAGEERSGLGFAVMESFMDRVHVRSAVGVGTTVTLEKTIRGRSGGLNDAG